MCSLVMVVDDVDSESTERFQVTFEPSAIVGNFVFSPDEATIFIVDDDPGMYANTYMNNSCNELVFRSFQNFQDVT